MSELNEASFSCCQILIGSCVYRFLPDSVVTDKVYYGLTESPRLGSKSMGRLDICGAYRLPC